MRTGAISCFRALLVRHDIDPRYQRPEAKQRLLVIYLPYILMLLETQTSIVLKASRNRLCLCVRVCVLVCVLVCACRVARHLSALYSHAVGDTNQHCAQCKKVCVLVCVCAC